MSRLIKLKRLLLDALFPPICLHCQANLMDKNNDPICAQCFSKITVHNTLFCGACFARLPENKKICHKDAPFLLAAVSQYSDEMRSLIHFFKYKSWTRLMPVFERLIQSYFNNLMRGNVHYDNWTVVPVPLHPDRKNSRGFNQSEKIAEIISRRLKLPLILNALVRDKKTKSQTDIKDYEEREKNVSEAFSILNQTAVTGKNLIIVDDVYTSGATARACAKALRAAGAKKILVFVLAKSR